MRKKIKNQIKSLKMIKKEFYKIYHYFYQIKQKK